MSHNLSRPRWKQCALLLILLSHAVFGSPIVPVLKSNHNNLEHVSNADVLASKNVQTSLEEDIFEPTLNQRSNRKKRFLYETLKRAKKAKNLALLTAASEGAKSVAQSVFKNVATFGVFVVIFNFLYSKVNQVLDFKTRMLTKLEQTNREPDIQILETSDSNTVASNVHTTTLLPPQVTEVSTFDPNKISLDLPGPLFANAFSIISATASVLEHLVQNTSVRISKLLEALRPIVQSASKNNTKSTKRETDTDFTSSNSSTVSSSDPAEKETQPSPVRMSFVAMTQQ